MYQPAESFDVDAMNGDPSNLVVPETPDDFEVEYHPNEIKTWLDAEAAWKQLDPVLDDDA